MDIAGRRLVSAWGVSGVCCQYSSFLASGQIVADRDSQQWNDTNVEGSVPGSQKTHEKHPHDYDRGEAMSKETAQFKCNYLLLGIVIHDV